MTDRGKARRLVVGVEDSAGARRALRYAAARAAREGAQLTALYAWSMFDVPRPESEPGIVPPLSAFEQSARARLSGILAEELGEGAAVVELRLVHESPTHALLSASREFDEVIVGGRGSGGFAGLLLGSTTSQLLHHAACPVTVVRGEG